MVKFCNRSVASLERHVSKKHIGFKGADLKRVLDLFNRSLAGHEIPRLVIDQPGSNQQELVSKNTPKRTPSKLYRCPLCNANRTNKATHLMKTHCLARGSPAYKDARSRMLLVTEPVDAPRNLRRLQASSNSSPNQWIRSIDSCFSLEADPDSEAIQRKVQTVRAWIEGVVDLASLDRCSTRSLAVGGMFHKDNSMNKAATRFKKMGHVYEYLKSIQNAYWLDDSVNPDYWRQTMDRLINMMKTARIAALKVKKADDVERSNVTAQNLIKWQLFSKLIYSDYVQANIRAASNVAEGSEPLPTTRTQFVNVRNSIIVYFMVKFMRRSLEFSEARLKELTNAHHFSKDGTEYRVMYLRRHKTRSTKSAWIFLKDTEYAAMKAYIDHYRSVITDCSGPECYLFPAARANRSNAQPCCSPFSSSNTNRILDKVAKQAGIPELVGVQLGVRKTRASLITAFREIHQNTPETVAQLAQLASHTVAVQESSYMFGPQLQSKLDTILRVEEMFRLGLSENCNAPVNPDTPAGNVNAPDVNAPNALGETSSEVRELVATEPSKCKVVLRRLSDSVLARYKTKGSNRGQKRLTQKCTRQSTRQRLTRLSKT